MHRSIKDLYLVFFGLLFFTTQTFAVGSKMVLTHLTTDNGLSQNTVVSAHKDKKGLMWFGTWDGLNKYDGYHFTVYKANIDPDDDNSPLHTRVDWIREDIYGFLWVKTFDNLLYRFDPSREYFLRVSVNNGGTKDKIYDKINEAWVLDNGIVWVSLQKGGCYQIKTDSSNKSLKISKPLKASPLNRIGKLNKVFLDSEGSTWLLAENGLARQSVGEMVPKMLFKEKTTSKSSNSYHSFLETKTDLYFGSGNGFFLSYDKTTKTFSQIQTSFTSKIQFLQILPEGRLFVGSGEDGFLLYNPGTEKMDYFDKEHYPSMRSNKILGAFSDKYGDIWLSIDEPGVLHFKPGLKTFSYLWLKTPNDKRSISQEATFYVFEDTYGTFWIHTMEGTLFPYDRQRNSLNWFHNKPGDADCVFKTNIQVAWADQEGVLWVCCGNQGIYKCVQRSREFNFTSMEPYIHSGTPDIRSLFQDPAGNVWVSSKAGDVRIFDKNMNSRGVLCRNGSLKSTSDINLAVYEIMMDRKGRIWLATKGQGLVMLKPENKDYSKFEIRFFTNNKDNKYSLSNNKLYDLYEDKNGKIWIASYDGGVMLLDESGDDFRFLHAGNDMSGYPIESCSRVRSIEGDKKGNIWVGTTNGFIVFSDGFDNVKNIKFYHYSRDIQTKNDMFSSDIYDILCDSKGRIWLGTFGGGLLLCKDFKLSLEPELISFNQKNGFHTDIVLSIAEDNKHKLWLTSENTLARFEPETGNRDLYNVSNGLESGDFLESSVYKTNNGILMIGNASGFYIFNPEKVERNLFSPNIVFTRLQLFGRDMQIGSKDNPLKKHIDDCSEIKLNHRQRTFNIEFAALDFQTPDNIQYEYKLEGFEDEWNNASKQRVATYTGLPRGSYTLLVKSTNSDGVWAENLKKLDIVVLPSFWETIWAYIIYTLIALVVIIGVIYLLLFYFRLKNEVVLEQKLTDLKLRFFTDISHELRTPLTLISAPIEHIIKQEEVSDTVRGQLQIVQRNTERMIRLLNQILDFRKVQNKKKRLKLQETLFVECVRKSCVNFEEIAREQNINFEIIDKSDGVLVWLDQNAIDTILFNLLSNAFKFTPSGKTIKVSVYSTNTEAILQVSDQGIGIEKSIQSKIFERFYTVDQSNEASRRSTGIGLSLVKELLSLHGASISVNSMPGEGTLFEVRFRLGAEHFSKEVDFILDDGVSGFNESKPDVFDEAESHFPENMNKEDSQMVLIVEDNEDLRPFLRTVLGKKFRVADAADGKTAWELTQSLMPDFIITDLMIPGISGKDFIKLVKNDDRTCHIPVVVLSAKTNMETKLECLDMGADDYITKPFSATFLEARVSNMLEQRARMQSYYREVVLLPDSKVVIEVPMPQAHNRDDEFMGRLMSVMESNISNGNFSVEQLCSIAGYGRTVFFNKLKSLTGFSPNEYIREVRIKRAAQLLEVGEYTVSQITYMVGMNDSRYFSKCFKQRYHMTPTEFREKIKISEKST